MDPNPPAGGAPPAPNNPEPVLGGKPFTSSVFYPKGEGFSPPIG